MRCVLNRWGLRVFRCAFAWNAICGENIRFLLPSQLLYNMFAIWSGIVSFLCFQYLEIEHFFPFVKYLFTSKRRHKPNEKDQLPLMRQEILAGLSLFFGIVFEMCKRFIDETFNASFRFTRRPIDGMTEVKRTIQEYWETSTDIIHLTTANTKMWLCQRHFSMLEFQIQFKTTKQTLAKALKSTSITNNQI